MAPRSELGSTEPEPREPASDQVRPRRNQVIGILLVAVAILAFTLLRANWHDLFPHGWWRW